MSTNSRRVTTNQEGIHDDLLETINRHLLSDYQRPITAINQKAFDQCLSRMRLEKRPIILDSGCGVGDSSRTLAKEYPEHWVIGIDQSEKRLGKQRQQQQLNNLILIQADLIDFWRLALSAHWKPDKHFILFPNPWPKKKHLQRRWHGHAIFPTLLNLGGQFELRTNWDLYALEMATSLDYLSYKTSPIETYVPTEFISPFEKKYHLSGQTLYRLTADLI